VWLHKERAGTHRGARGLRALRLSERRLGMRKNAFEAKHQNIPASRRECHSRHRWLRSPFDANEETGQPYYLGQSTTKGKEVLWPWLCADSPGRRPRRENP